MVEKLGFNTTAAAVALLRKAVEIAERAYAEDPAASVPKGQEWELLSRTADSAVFRLGTSSFDARTLALATAIGELRESPEVDAFAEALAADEALAPYYEKMAWSGGAGRMLSAQDIAAELIAFALRGCEWETVRDEGPNIWAKFVTSAFHEDARVTLVAPLHNFVGAPAEVTLAGGVVIDQMTDEEISHAIWIGAVTTPFPGATSGDFWVRTLWAVRYTYADPRIFTAPDDVSAVERQQQGPERAAHTADGVVHALMLFKSGLVSAEAAMLSRDELQPFGGGWISRLYLGTRVGKTGPDYDLKADEVEEFARFHEALVKARAAHPPLDVAVRRFGDAAGRTRPDDQLTDLIISLEALLLTKSERGEKRFQIALRVAACVEAGGAKRRDVFKFVKRAYDVRSTIVHGGTPEKKDLKNVAGEKVELQAFADEATEIVRRLLRQVTEEIEDTGRFAVDWEVQLLGEE